MWYFSIVNVEEAFGGNVVVKNTTDDVLSFIRKLQKEDTVLLMMSSGNFDGIDYDALGTELSDWSLKITFLNIREINRLFSVE